MWPRFGIKIGNSTLCVASAKKDGKIDVVANKQGDRVSNAILLYDGDEIEVGLTITQGIVRDSSTVCNSLQLFPRNLSDEDINKAIKYVPCKFDKNLKTFVLNSKREEGEVKCITPFNACLELFKASFELARQCHFLEHNPSVVVSIPQYFPSSSWRDIADAVECAGFHVAQVITDAAAAIVACESIENKISHTKFILYIKCGGLITSFTLFEACNGVYSVVSTSQPFYLGGNQFTESLVNFICAEFVKKYQLNPKNNRRSLEKIRTSADNCKHALTTLQSTQIYIDSLMDGIDFNIQMSRARFESIIQPVITDFMILLNNAMEEINKENFKIDEVILAGGSLKIPKMQQTIKSRFFESHLKTTFPPDEIVAIGCARQSLYIKPNTTELELDMLCSITTFDIYIWCNNNLVEKKLLLEKGKTLPNTSVVELRAGTANSDDGNVLFNIESNNSVQQIRVNDIVVVNGIYHIEASIDIHNGKLRVTLASIQ